MSELEGVDREQLPLATTVQMKLANGRLQRSRRSCSPDCVTYLWVPFHQMLQVLKMRGDPSEPRRWRRYHTSVFISLSVSILSWLLSGDDKVWPEVVYSVLLEKWGWNQDVLTKATVERMPEQLLVLSVWGALMRPTPRNPPPLTAVVTNNDW